MNEWVIFVQTEFRRQRVGFTHNSRMQARPEKEKGTGGGGGLFVIRTERRVSGCMRRIEYFTYYREKEVR
jgi:hypothetical protein